MKNWKKYFKIFESNPNWTYLDTAATALKPDCLAQRLTQFYDREYATVNRAIYKESLLATKYFAAVKEKLAPLFNCLPHELIWTKGTTEGLNLLAHTLGEKLKEGDAILISEAEHHSNIVPWQLLKERKNIQLKVFKVNAFGEVDLESFIQELTEDVKIVSIPHVSNVLGTIFPIEKMAELVHAKNGILIVDGAQAPFHLNIDFKALDVDFYVFSAHKLYGPNGLGALYGKEHMLDSIGPFLGGGDMIETVTFEKTTFQAPPLKFEAGTPNIADVIGFGSVLEFLSTLSLEEIINHEKHLETLLIEELKNFPRVKILGKAKEKIGITSFVIDGIHPMDLALFLDSKNIAIRSGHLCAQPLLKKFGVNQVARVSFGLYNHEEDVMKFISALKKGIELF